MRYTICAALLFFLGSVSAQLPTGGLLAYYPFDNDAADKSDKNNNGQITGGVTAAYDRFGNPCGALQFNGVDGFIRVPNSVSLKSPSSAITITAWFTTQKTAPTNGAIQLVLLSKSGTPNKAAAIAQYRFVLTHAFGDSYSNISLSQDVTATDNNYNAHPIEDDEWYFLTVVYEESWANIFLNGKLVSQTIVKKPFTPNDLDLEIGRDVTAAPKYFKGALDELRIYNHGLTPFEVSNIYKDETAKAKAHGIAVVLPENITKNADAGKCSAVISFKEPSLNTGCGKAELKQIGGLPSGSAFYVGRNINTYETISSSGELLTDSFAITIADKEPPVFHCAADVAAATPAGAQAAKVDYTVPTATDNCPNLKIELVSGIASGSEFPVGTTTVRYKATDPSGNTAECSFKVTVDETKKVERILHCPTDIIAYSDSDAENVIVNYKTPQIEINGNMTAMKRTKGFSSGSLFRVGKSEIIHETGDTGSENIICHFNITVKDIIKPVITCPADMTLTCGAGQKSMVLTYPLPKATDGGSALSVKQISGLSSGSAFYPGVTVIKYESTDESGNKSECSFKITLLENKEPPKPVVVPPPPPVSKPETKKETEVKPSAPPKPVVAEIKEREIKQVPEVLTEREEKIRQAEKIFLHPEPVKKEEPKPVAVKKEEVKEKIEETPKPLPPPVAEIKEKEKVEVKATPIAVEPEKPKDTAPVIPVKPAVPILLNCPKNITKKSDAGKCGTWVSYTAPDVRSGNDVKITQTKGNPSGNFFRGGITTNTFSASDPSGQHKECSFQITVKDDEAPVFNCPNDTVIMLPANRRGIIYYYHDPVVYDNCAVDTLIKEAGPKNGCFLEVGVHPFIYKAMDAAGNFTNCTHSVIIKSAPPVPNVEPPQILDDQLSIGSDSIHYEYRAEVKDCFLTVFLYDDGEEDGDIVSVIFNGQVIVNKETIRLKEHQMIKRNLVLDGGNENYLVSKAWNMGKFGLNTLKIDIYEGNIENEKKDLKNLKPVLSRVLHSKPGKAGGIILKCSE